MVACKRCWSGRFCGGQEISLRDNLEKILRLFIGELPYRSNSLVSKRRKIDGFPRDKSEILRRVGHPFGAQNRSNTKGDKANKLLATV